MEILEPKIQIQDKQINVYWDLQCKQISADEKTIRIPECSDFRAASITISGKIPIWLYMFTVLQISRQNPASIFIQQPQGNEPIQIYPSACKHSAETEKLYVLSSHESGSILEYRSINKTDFSPQNLPGLLSPICTDKTSNRLIITGAVSNFLGAAAALAALKSGWKRIEWWSPKNHAIIQVYPELKETDNMPQMLAPGKIIGIVGDPNSGKSMFAELLEHAGLHMKQKIWRYDCDYSAPTPDWYLQMCHHGHGEEGKQKREKYKKKWTHEAEIEIASELESAKKYLPWLVADMPGGIHKNDAKPAESIRIPPGREIMMQAVDYFVIINRRDRHSGDLWKKALQKIGLEKRIACIIDSVDPEADISFSAIDSDIAMITGLNRDHKVNDSHCYCQLWNYIEKKVSQLEICIDKSKTKDY